MNKRLFVLLVILMSLSLIGIIFVQGLWIKQSVEDKEERFSNVVNGVLSRVTEKIAKREIRDYSDRYLKDIDSTGSDPVDSRLKNFLFIDRDANSNEIKLYSHGILEEDYNIASTFFDNGSSSSDSTTIKNITSKRTTLIFEENYGLDGKAYSLSPKQRVEKIGGLSSIEKAAFDDVSREYAKKVPIHKRVSTQEIELLLSRELENQGIDIDYEYGVYSKGLPTKVKSRKFKLASNTLYSAPIFADSEGVTEFSLLLTFPKKKRF